MKFIRKLDWKYRKPNAVERMRSCLRASRQKIAKLGSHVGGGGDVLVAAGSKKTRTTTAMAMTATNTIFKDKAVAACKDLENFHKISPPPPPGPPRHLRRATKETFMQDGSFHEAVGSVLLLAELFGIMPVKGVKAKSPADLSFSWLSIRTIYSILLIVMTFVDMALTVYMVLDQPISFNSVEPIIFRGSNIIVCISFLNLAKKWPDLMAKWRAVEEQLPGYESLMEKGKLATSIWMVVFVAMMLSLVEHFLSIIANIHYANFCPLTDDPIENFFLTTGTQIFYVFPYSPGLGWYGKILNFVMTFGWNYMDSFVMVMSMGLADLFKQVNANLERHKGMHMPEAFWSERRIQYRSICILCEQVDNAISVITMISFSNNLYFICIQLLKSLNKMPSFAHALYFYFSLFFLLGRTLAVSLYSADIHDESKNPLRCLRCVPKDSWCQEVKRFSEDVSTDLVALSGMKFFHLTRKLVLSVAGTIVTYELVLIQFRENGNVWDCERNDLM